MTKRRPLALGAAVTIGFGSLFLASPAMAEESADTAKNTSPAQEAPAQGEKQESGADSGASSEETQAADEAKAAAEAEAAELAAIKTATDFEAATGADVVGVSDKLILVDIADKDDQKVKKFAEASAIPVAFINKAVPDAATDVVGGAGYMGPRSDGYLGGCSIGFTAFTPQGDPALITAGHCSNDSDITEVALTLPSQDPAHTGDPDTGFEPNGTGVAGEFGFSQYGGPGHTTGAENDPASTDIAVIDITNDDLKLHPEVTDWTTAGQDDLAASATPIKGVAKPVSGTVSKSGRTTGLTTGSTTLNLLYDDGNVYPTEILDGWMRIGGRWVHGFLGGALTEHGDSGGAVYQGDKAVGVVSGGPEEAPEQGDDWAWYTMLQDGLELTGGYEVALDIDAPVVTSPAVGASVEPGSNIVVSVASNATELSIGTGNAGESRPVSNGQVTFQAPTELGTYTYQLAAHNGFSSSATTEFTVTVVAAPIAAPSIDNVDTTNQSPTLTGTGIAGATVSVSIDGNVVGTATVGADGKWSLAVEGPIAYGQHAVSATQTVDGETSASASGDLMVRPVAAEISSIEEGHVFPAGEGPSSLSGTGLAGATVTVTVGDQVYTATVDADGNWTVDFGQRLASGDYVVKVKQSVNGVDSPETGVSFSVFGQSGGTTPPPGGGGGELPITGGTGMMALGITALGLLAAGGVVTVIEARRRKAAQV